MEEYKKHFCRLVTSEQLDDEDIIEYFDIVQSIVAPKLTLGLTDDAETVSINVTVFTSDNGFIHEIVLEEQINLDEGEEIADLLAAEFDFDFDLETSLNIEE